MTSTLGLALATTAPHFRLAPCWDGWACSSPAATRRRTRFSATCRSSPRTQLGLNPVLTASVNSAAGVMGKMISLTSIAVAVAATGMTKGGREQTVPVHHQAQHSADADDGRHLDDPTRTCSRNTCRCKSPK